ncbi:thioredoxin family protein [Jiella endophytica]|uniref:Thioredoxin family protein n=1 Tax=Jiella endophytica TaxID=2558362 RepID=A0A4Y8RVC8_9HYPH|nr:thioredoxin family protein [Jiella endophytica]TFF27777.1 thioredoxin family protein [Jiella endophytica]
MAAQPPVCAFGWPALDAELPGVDGKTHRLFECRGDNGLLIAFICNHCPYVKAVIGRLVRDARDLSGIGIGTVAISSNDAAAYPEDSFQNMQRFAEAHRFPFPYLHDEEQTVAQHYGAVCTPDFFGFDRDLKLQYRGRLDASRKRQASEETERDLFEAMRMVAETGEGPREQIPSIGCSIKWKDAA